MPLVGDGTQCGLDLVPPRLIVECSADQICDERTAQPGACPPIQLSDQLIVELNVYTHVLTLAHCLAMSSMAPIWVGRPRDKTQDMARTLLLPGPR